MRFFFFGTLMDKDIMEAVAGHALPDNRFLPSRLTGYRRVVVRKETFPMLLEAPGAEVDGVVVEGLSAGALDRIHFFESVEYEARRVDVMLEDGARTAAHLFAATDYAANSGEDWSSEVWQARHKEKGLRETFLWMGLYGFLEPEHANGLWDETLAGGRDLIDFVREIRREPYWQLPAIGRMSSK